MKTFVCFALALLVAFTAFGHVPSGIEGGYDRKEGTWTPANATFSHAGIIGGTVATFNFGRDCQTLLEPRTGYTAAEAQAAIKAAIASRWPDSVFPYTDPNTTNPTTSQIQAINNQYIRQYQDCRDDIHYHWSISNTPASERNRLEIAWTWIRETVHMRFIMANRPTQLVQLTISPSTGANVKRPDLYTAEITFWRHGTYTVTGEVTVDGQTLTAQETIIYPRLKGDWGNDDRIHDNDPPVEKSVEPEPKTSLQQFEPAQVVYLESTNPVPKGVELAPPTAESTEPQLALGDGKESVPYAPTYQPEVQPIPDPHVSYSMTFPAGVNSLHLPFKPRKSFFFTDLVNLLGDVNVNSISALRPTVQQWTIITSSHSVHNEWISPQRGFVADMKNTVTVDLVREPTNYGYNIIRLAEGQNLIGVPRESSQLEIVSDFFVVFDSVMWVELIEDGETRTLYHPLLTTERSTLDGDTEILPTRGYMLMSLEDDEYAIWGNAWGDVFNQLPQQEE